MNPLRLGAVTNDLSGLLQKGLFEEEANRNLDAAVQAYQSLVTAFDRDRKLAATAVFRLGECYRKLGKTNEAVLQYERIVREFADEATLATLSRQNLAGMGIAPAKTTPSVAFTERLQSIIHRVGADTASDSEETEIRRLRARTAARLAREEELYASLKKLSPSDLLKTLPTVAADSLLQELLQQLNLAEQNLVALKQDFTQDHPTVRTAATQVETLRKKAQERANGILAGLEVNVSALKASLASLEQAEKDAEKLRSVPLGRTDATGTIAPDDEETEIRRLQAMIKDSPDLLNAPGDDRLTPLCRAASKGQLHVAKFLLDRRADVNRKAYVGPTVAGGTTAFWTPLHFAALHGHKAVVELLLARGADANARDERGRRPLHIAAENGFREVAAALAANKADLSVRDNDGWTPLHLASGRGQAEVVEFLIAKGAELEAKASGWTPLFSAVLGGNIDTVKILLKAGANVNANAGYTALQYAVEKNDAEMVSVLLAHKADVNARNAKGQTPLDLAVLDQSRAAIATMLRQHGAREGSPKPDSVNAKQSEGPGTATSVGGGKIIAGRIYISGQVRKQGPIDLLPDDNLTVAKAIVRAGGFTDSADKKKVLVVRASESGSATNKLELDMTEILEQGNLEKDVVLRPEDRVIVPSRLVPQ